MYPWPLIPRELVMVGFRNHRAHFRIHRAHFRIHRAHFRNHRAHFRIHRAHFRNHCTKPIFLPQCVRQSFIPIQNTKQNYTSVFLIFNFWIPNWKTKDSAKNLWSTALKIHISLIIQSYVSATGALERDFARSLRMQAFDTSFSYNVCNMT